MIDYICPLPYQLTKIELTFIARFFVKIFLTFAFSYRKQIPMNAYQKEGRDLELAIARRIKEKREQLGWSLGEFAKHTGMSKGHLWQIEKGEKIPPISTLAKIAFRLGINVLELITGEKNQQNLNNISVVKAEDRVSINDLDASHGSEYESFGFGMQDAVMNAYIVRLSHKFHEKPIAHVGQKFVYAIDGTHELNYDGKIYKLESGDAAYFKTDRPYMSRSVGDKPATVLVVFCNP